MPTIGKRCGLSVGDSGRISSTASPPRARAAAGAAIPSASGAPSSPARVTNECESSRRVDSPTACFSRPAEPDVRPAARRVPPSTEGTPGIWSGPGLIGGKGIDESVAERPAVLLTLTAPSFGAGPLGRTPGTLPPRLRRTARCPHGRALSCSAHHDEGDAIVGSPLCVDCYDFAGAVLQNACTPELWRRTTIYVLRRLAGTLGWSAARDQGANTLSFCRVAEYQRRGVVHLHAVIRADGVDGEPPPLNPRSWPRLRCPPPVRSPSPIRWASPVGATRSTSRCSTARRPTGPAGGGLRGQVRHQELRPRAVPSTPGSSRKRTWPAARSPRTYAAWSRWRGRSVATRRSSRSTSGATPTVSATAVTSCPSPTATPPASVP